MILLTPCFGDVSRLLPAIRRGTQVPRADDRALARASGWARVHGADCAGVRQGDRCASEVVHAELCVTSPADYVVIGSPEATKVHCLRVLNVRNQQLPRSIILCQVDC